MRRGALAIAVVAMAIGMSGCGSSPKEEVPVVDAPQSEQAQSELVAAEEPQSAEPTEVILDQAAAGDLFLGIVCGINEKSELMLGLAGEADGVWVNGGDPDVTALTGAYRRLADVALQGITVLDDPYYVWPDNVAQMITQMRDGYMAGAAARETAANANSYQDLLNVTHPSPEMPAQEIRYQLGVGSDPIASCDGHNGQLPALYEQSVARKG